MTKQLWWTRNLAIARSNATASDQRRVALLQRLAAMLGTLAEGFQEARTPGCPSTARIRRPRARRSGRRSRSLPERTTSYDFNDPLDRLKSVTLPDGGSTTYSYGDTSYPNTVQTTSAITSSNDPNCTPSISKVSLASFDGLGRPIQGRQTDPQGNVFVDTTYDALGRVYQVSNPYRAGTAPLTTTLYDSLSRPISRTAPDSSTTAFGYTGNQTSVTNPRNLTKVQIVDALGRLTQVTEENSTIASYSYDPLGNLISVMHGVTGTDCLTTPRARCFTYDSLSRLRSAKNPESGTITYTYDENNNLASKVTSGRNVSLVLAYDLLDRVTSKTYTGGANGALAPPNVVASVGYVYDTATNGLTRLGAVTAATKDGKTYTTSLGSYDAMGRVTGSSQSISGTAAPYSFSYAYNVAGGLELMTYPSLRRVKTCYDSVGRIAGVTNGTTGAPYATVDPATGYAPHGGLKKLTLGNGVVETTLYDSPDGVVENDTRLQPTHITAAKGASTLLTLQYRYCPGGAVTTGCTTNNGNVWGHALARPAASFSVSQTFGYDSVDRLTASVEAGASGWSLTNDYDVWGNRFVTALAGLPGLTAQTPQAASWFNTANQVIGWSYDGDGNLLSWGGNATMDYDAENRMVKSTPTSGTASSYTYDGMGRRVQAVTPSGTTNYVYDAMGQLAAEYLSAPAAAGVQYLTADTLGSTRLLTDGNGADVGKYDYLPSGEEIWGTANARGTLAAYGAAVGVKQKFTGKERDAETGLDYFGARYMSSAQGRFTSPDPLYIEMRRLGDPQRLNLYAYGRNNPLKFTDPTGLDITVTGDYGDDYLKYLQKNVSFKIKFDNGKVAVDQGGDMKKLRKSLKGGDRALFDAITDTKHHVTIATSGKDPNIDFGRFDGGGKNSIDFADLKLLEGPKNAGGPFTPERVVGHETLEAYAASKGDAIGDAHNFANQFFGGLEGPIPSSMQLFGNAAAGTVSRVAFDSPLYGNPGQSVRMTREFLTPIPMNSIPRGHIPANIVEVEKKP